MIKIVLTLLILISSMASTHACHEQLIQKQEVTIESLFNMRQVSTLMFKIEEFSPLELMSKFTIAEKINFSYHFDERNQVGIIISRTGTGHKDLFKQLQKDLDLDFEIIGGTRHFINGQSVKTINSLTFEKFDGVHVLEEYFILEIKNKE